MFDAKSFSISFWDRKYRACQEAFVTRQGRPLISRRKPIGYGGDCGCNLGHKTGRKLAGNVATAGGIAAIAGLGYLAYKNYKSGQSPQTAEQPVAKSQSCCRHRQRILHFIRSPRR